MAIVVNDNRLHTCAIHDNHLPSDDDMAAYQIFLVVLPIGGMTMNNYLKQFTLSLLAYAVQRDISVQQLCTLANIDLVALQSPAAYRLSHKQINDLWLNAVHLSKDPMFGLHLGESMQLTALGIVGELIKSSRSIGEGMTNAATFANLLTDALQMDVRQSGRSFTIRFAADEEGLKSFPETFRQMIDLSLVMTIQELDGLVLKKIKPKRALLPFEVAERDEYARALRCEPTRSTEYHLEFDGTLWDEPIITANYELQTILLKFASEQLAQSSSKPTLKERINQYLISHAYLGIPTIDEMAANFNVSARTLQRKLNEEGVTYQEISDGIRKALALNYVNSGNYQAKEISIMLGYNELSAFTRAFKRWTGHSPGRYQGRTG